MQVFIRRPVMAVALNLVLLIIGVVAFSELPLRHRAEMPRQEIEIVTEYPGANSSVVEQRITKPLENALSGIDSIKQITSNSRDSMSSIQVTFKADNKYNQHLSQVRDRLLEARSTLPEQAKQSYINEKNNNDSVLMYLGAYDSQRTASELYDYLQRNVIDRMKLVEGVAEVGEFGAKPYVIEVQVDPVKLREFSLSMDTIRRAIEREKMFASGGEVDAITGKKTLVIHAPFSHPVELENISLGDIQGIPISLANVAKVVVTHKTLELVIRADGNEVTGLYVTAKPQANPIYVAKEVNNFLIDLQRSLPDSMDVKVLFDATKAFKQGVDQVYSALWEAVILVAVIVIFSLASLRTAIIPIITVPLCLISSFSLMWMFGFTINPITLLAMVLAVGLVVDDAIVVVENIHRHMETGLSAFAAAMRGMKEITFAVIVMTVTLAAVYMPFAFQSDPSAFMFREFAWTLAGSVLISGVVALSLTPALSGQWLNLPSTDKQNFLGKVEIYWQHLSSNYKIILAKVLHHPGKILMLALLLAGLGGWGFLQLDSELEPVEDDDLLYGWMLADNSVADSVRLGWAKSIEKVVNEQVPERDILLVGRWREHDWWMLGLKPRAQRDVGVDTVVARLQKPLSEIPGPIIGVSQGYKGGNKSEALSIEVQYSGKLTTLLDSVRLLNEKIGDLPGVAKVDSPELQQQVRYKVKLHRGIAAKLGVRTTDVEDVLYTFLSGVKITEFTFDGFEYDVILRGQNQHRVDLTAVNKFFVTGKDNQSIPLGTLVDIQRVLEPEKFYHFERLRSARINVELKSDYALEKAIQEIELILRNNLPNDALYDLSGQAEQFKESRQAMLITFILSLAFIYLVLAALFESFLDPFIVLFTVPLSIVGAVLAVKLFGGTNNIYMQVGLITLIGLITKHGILITDFANKLRAEGKTIREAILNAAVSRLRPILMTTFAMICSAVPLVLSLGSGAQARAHIGWVIVGGMTTGTLLSLFVIPIVYMILQGYVARQKSIK